jgi:cobyrinic acid a,c-diamide synthase
MLGPRVVIAGTHSGAGKTTVTAGLLAAFRRRGLAVAGAKVGPDFIDPGYHSVACGRPPRNLDPWMCGPDAVAPLAARAAAGAHLLIVEGVMGLFDGAADGGPSSTADVARLLDAPVVLVVDASSLSASVAATVHGFATWDPRVRVAGVILNRVGSPTHERLLREAMEELPVAVLGAVGRDRRLDWRSRHLGLVPVDEHRADVASSIDAVADVVDAGVDLAALEEVARSAPPLAPPSSPLPSPGPPVRVGVAGGRAFSFVYTDTLEALSAAGAEVVAFDPLTHRSLPRGLDGLLIGGGFPEVYAAELADNRPFLDDLAAAVAGGVPTWAECGGLLLLCRSLDGAPMAGSVAADAAMSDRLTLGYRRATALHESVVGPAGLALRGHEFHYSRISPEGAALRLSSRWGARPDGWATPTLLATYLHYHPGGDPSPVARFVDRCRR